jgi:hypothetical protein
MTAAERNYPVHKQELLAVIHALQKWKMLLLGMKVNVMTNHHALVHLLKQRNLSRRQARWTEVIADFDLHFNYIPGKDNSVADALSCKMPGEEEPQPADVACVAALAELGSTLSTALTAQIKEGYMSDPFCQSLRGILPLCKDCVKSDGLYFIDGRLVIPEVPDLRHNLINEAHHHLGHLGYLKTITELRKEFFWPQMVKDVAQAVLECSVCQHTKAPMTTPAPGRMLTPSFPRVPLQDLAVDFVGPLKSSRSYDMLLTCTC